MQEPPGLIDLSYAALLSLILPVLINCILMLTWMRRELKSPTVRKWFAKHKYYAGLILMLGLFSASSLEAFTANLPCLGEVSRAPFSQRTRRQIGLAALFTFIFEDLIQTGLQTLLQYRMIWVFSEDCATYEDICAALGAGNPILLFSLGLSAVSLVRGISSKVVDWRCPPRDKDVVKVYQSDVHLEQLRRRSDVVVSVSSSSSASDQSDDDGTRFHTSAPF